ncbi:hypothetical protein ABZ471_44525 [Streptomyces sp. NPDC005728]|uniref:hypothetical protein n=1 Tax=Streptomyces sp. NPDC005728 TaxID=3157054 RepID=UPI0033CDAB94
MPSDAAKPFLSRAGITEMAAQFPFEHSPVETRGIGHHCPAVKHLGQPCQQLTEDGRLGDALRGDPVHAFVRTVVIACG